MGLEDQPSEQKSVIKVNTLRELFSLVQVMYNRIEVLEEQVKKLEGSTE